MLTVPQQPPALSTTGKLVARCSWSFRRASSTGSSAPQHADEGRMISLTRTSEARRSSADTPQHTSRSVTTPTSLSVLVSSTTGAQPQPESRIARAACAAVSCGVQHEDASIGFITSLQQLIVFPLSVFEIDIQTTRSCAQQKRFRVMRLLLGLASRSRQIAARRR